MACQAHQTPHLPHGAFHRSTGAHEQHFHINCSRKRRSGQGEEERDGRISFIKLR